MLSKFRPGEHIVKLEDLKTNGNRATIYRVQRYQVGRKCRYFAPTTVVGAESTIYHSITDVTEANYVGEDRLREHFPELCI